MKKIHLLCNAHLDPVWMWEWEEGATAAVSTFRVAADFCEEYGGFIFNHNEALLYKWVEEYEPALFKRIQKLVAEGKWNIMGGWYLQPDCNMPSGESFVRQILEGRTYFREKFNVEPTTAINFDPFGHSRGLVQILKKFGYDSYIFCRPGQEDCPLSSEDFIWVGFDGSEIVAHRAFASYNSLYGQAREKIEKWMDTYGEKTVGLVLWGIGNHGGGPSRVDLNQVNALIDESKEYKIEHSIPERYFKELRESNLPSFKYDKGLNAWAVGCYTSQVRIKQKHRQLENELYMLEKMMSCASVQGYTQYPSMEIQEALQDLLLSEFHDTLPGTSIQPVEEDSLRLLNHGLEIVSRLKMKAFFALASGQEKAEEGEIPILVYNPHPFKINRIVECEFQLHDQNWRDEFSLPVIYRDGERIPCQVEKEDSNINLDWRKKVVFAAELNPGQMNRFNCRIQLVPEKPRPMLHEEDGRIVFNNGEFNAVINCQTGLIDEYTVDGRNFLKENAFLPMAIEDNDDPWGMTVQSFRGKAEKFALMTREEGTKFSGLSGNLLNSVRVIEDGKVRTVIEAMFVYGDSFICQTYKLPKRGREIQVQVRVYWNEKNKMLKLSVPTALEDAALRGQVAYGAEELRTDGRETVSQKWLAVTSAKHDCALSCINDGVYGSDFENGELRISLSRSPAYSGHPIPNRPIMEQDRFSPRIDQGERLFNFWFSGGNAEERLTSIDRESLVHNEKPFALSFFPSGEGKKPKAFATLSDDAIQITACKKAEDAEDYIIRLFEPTGQKRETTISFPSLSLERQITLNAFEIKTLRLNLKETTVTEVGLMER